MSTPPIPPLCILVADDAPRIRDAIRVCLEPQRHNVAFVASGREAIRMLAETKFDLIITDVVMPDGDGLEVIREVKRVQPDARVVVMSGGGLYLQQSECIRMANTMGAHAALKKPFTRRDLLEAMKLALAAKAGTDAPFSPTAEA